MDAEKWNEIVAEWQADRRRRSGLWELAEFHMGQAEKARQEEEWKPFADVGEEIRFELEARRPHWRAIKLSHLRAAKHYALAAGVPVMSVEIPSE